MIKELLISNFQSHKDTHLEFSPGVNIIVGSSDSGKTAILRALKWLVTNRPSGDSIRSNWGGKTSVELFTDDAHIVRSKDKEAEYILGDTHFKAFSTEVPKEIQDALNLSEINMSNQLDAPFLLSETPGVVAQHFNRVAHLDMIDSGLQNVQKWIRELEQTIKYKEADIKTKEESLQTYVHLDKFEAEVEILEDLDNRLHQKETALQRLNKLIRDYHGTEEELSAYTDLLDLEGKVDEVLGLIDKSTALDQKLIKLESLVDNIREVQYDLNQQEDLLQLGNIVGYIFENRNLATTIQDNRSKLMRLLIGIKANSEEINIKAQYVTSLKKVFDKEMGETCMLCGQTIKR